MPIAFPHLGSSQKSPEAFSENWQLRGFTLPNRNDPPSESSYPTLFVRSRWTLESILFRQNSLRVLG